MLKGNSAVCKRSEIFNWGYVDEVILHDGTKLKWLRVNSILIEVIIGPDLQYVNIDDVRLKCHQVHIDQKARQLKGILEHLFTNARDIRQYQRPAALAESDSGGEQVTDSVISPAFPPDDWKFILEDFLILRDYFNTAKTVSFDNAAGKVFLCELMKFACWIKRPFRKFANMGTNASGEEQPGCTQITYYWLKYENDRSKSRSQSPSRPSPSQSRSCTPSTPSTSAIPSYGRIYNKETHNRYPDVSFWDYIQKLYRIIGKIKSGDAQSFDDQTTEQMCGLLRENQKCMLGIAIKPSKVMIKILRKYSDRLVMHTFPENRLDKLETIQLIFELIIAFIFCVDC